MPSLIDLTEKDARATFQKVGLDLGDIKMEYQTNPAKIGNVIEFHAGGLNDRLAASGEKWPLLGGSQDQGVDCGLPSTPLLSQYRGEIFPFSSRYSTQCWTVDQFSTMVMVKSFEGTRASQSQSSTRISVTFPKVLAAEKITGT